MNKPEHSKNLASPRVVRELLDGAGIRPRRYMGQNFLVDQNVLVKIENAAALAPDDVVIEIGAGLGALTQTLIGTGAMVYSLEADPRLFEILSRELGHAQNLVLLEGDAMKIDLAGLWDHGHPESVRMVSNLPYKIAATLMVGSLRRYPWIVEYTITIQREVAERMTSPPGVRSYSAATVKVQCYASVEKVGDVSRNSFFPRPRVDSTILRLVRGAGAGLPGDEKLFDLLVTAAFSQRRKKLANSLCAPPLPVLDRATVVDALGSLGMSRDSRPEDLSPLDFLNLTNVLGATLDEGPS